MEEEKKNSYGYTKKQMIFIRLHWVVLFVVCFAVFAFSAMKSLIGISPLVGYTVCVVLSGLISYFMSYSLYEYGKKYGIIAYILVGMVIVMMLIRYK